MFARRSFPRVSLLVLFGAACGLQDLRSIAVAAQANVRCEILAEEHDHDVVLNGSITTDVPVSGTYELSAMKSGAGNNSHVYQSGSFDVGAGTSVLAGTLMLGGPGNTEATLKIRWADGTIICTRRLEGAL